MDDDDKKVLKLVQKSKEKPPEDNTPGVTPDDLLKEGIGNYESLILVGWSGDHFKVSWNLGLTPDEVYVLLDLAKSRLMANMYEF
jgi:hypothetical protein